MDESFRPGVKAFWRSVWQSFKQSSNLNKVLIICAFAGIALAFYEIYDSNSQYQQLKSESQSIVYEIRTTCFAPGKEYCNIRTQNQSTIKAALAYFESIPNSEKEKAILYVASGDFETANTLLRSIENQTFSPDIYYQLAYINYNLKNFDDAIRYCLNYVEFRPESLGCGNLIAVSSLYSNNYQAAELAYTIVHDNAKIFYLTSLTDRGIVRYKLGKVEEALADALTAHFLNQTVCNTFYVALFYLETGDLYNGVNWMNKLFATNSTKLELSNCRLQNPAFFKNFELVEEQTKNATFEWRDSQKLCFRRSSSYAIVDNFTTIQIDPICYNHTLKLYPNLTGHIIRWGNRTTWNDGTTVANGTGKSVTFTSLKIVSGAVTNYSYILRD